MSGLVNKFIFSINSLSKVSLSVGFLLYAVLSNINVAAVYAYSGSGSGTSENPYQVTSCAELADIANDLSANYLLMNNLDCESAHTRATPAGQPFGGTFDGGGFDIALDVDTGLSDQAGLFGYTSGATIKNVSVSGTVIGNWNTGAVVGYAENTTLDNVTSDANVTGGSYVGGVVGTANQTSVTNATSTGAVNDESGDYTGGVAGLVAGGASVVNSVSSIGPVTGASKTGGLFGASECGALIENSHSTSTVVGTSSVGGLSGFDGCEGPGGTWNSNYFNGSVSGVDSVGGIIGHGDSTTLHQVYALGTVESTGSAAGGLVGYGAYGTTIDQSFANSTVTANTYSGGLAGWLESSSSVITDSYARGAVNGNKSGGLVGEVVDGLTINSSYSTTVVDQSQAVYGGLIAAHTATGTVGSFWDTQTSLLGTSLFGTGKTTAEMKDIATYTDTSTSGLGSTAWDFTGNPNADNADSDIWSSNPDLNDGYPCLNWFEGCSTGSSGNSSGALIVQPDNDASKAILIEQKEGTEICGNFDDGATTQKEAQLTVQDQQYDYPSYFIGFTLGGCDVGGTVTIHAIFTGDFDPSTAVLRKYNATTNTFATVTPLTKTSTTLNDLPALDVTYQITDGGELDQDGSANGTIVDPVSLGVKVTSQVDETTLASTGEPANQLVAIATLLSSAGMIAILMRKYLSLNRD